MADRSEAGGLFTLRGGETWREPWADYRHLRDTDPVHRVVRSANSSQEDYYVLSLFDDVFDALRDTATFSSAQGLTPDAGAMEMFDDADGNRTAAPIVMMDPPDHTAMRRLVSRPMTPRRVAVIEAEVRDFVDERLNQLSGDSTDVDIIDLLFKPLPSFVVAHYLGVPKTDREKFDRWTGAIVSANAVGDIASAADAALELFTYANELIELRRTAPGDDLVSDLVAVGEEVASAAWIVGFVFTMVTGGNDTVTGLLGGAAELLTDNRDQRQRLIDDPTMVRPAINELLRLTSPVQNLARTTTRDVEVRGTHIPADTKVLLLYGSANRDEREFGPTAEELDVGRSVPKMLSLGYGPHHCLGAAAARLQSAVALEALLERFPDFSVDSARGEFAQGAFTRRYETLPFSVRA
jgi:cytochrome P450